MNGSASRPSSATMNGTRCAISPETNATSRDSRSSLATRTLHLAFRAAARAVSGYLLIFPFYATDITNMQWAQIVHGTVAMLFVAAMLAHIYIGTIGMEGAFEAMGEGTVDVNWAKQHHALWLQEEQARTGPNQSQSQVRASATPAE